MRGLLPTALLDNTAVVGLATPNNIGSSSSVFFSYCCCAITLAFFWASVIDCSKAQK